jgi:hypothetical protein
MERSLSGTARLTFSIHFIFAFIVGLGWLVFPFGFGGLFGYPSAAGLEPPLRGFGAMTLSFGGLTSLYGFLATR